MHSSLTMVNVNAPDEASLDEELVCTIAHASIQSLDSRESSKGSKGKKRLRFDTQTLSIPPSPHRATWWSPKEYMSIRKHAKFLIQCSNTECEGMSEAYARALHMACSLSDGDLQTVLQQCSDQIHCMLVWVSGASRGLERYHQPERLEFAAEARSALLRVASQVSADELAVFYSEYSKSAALYARFCGQADAHVVQDDNGPAPLLLSPRFDARKEASKGRRLVKEYSEKGFSVN